VSDGRVQWTEALYRPSGGQDHLGLGSVSSDRILPLLAPGINVLTPHPRYWSFYTFLLDEFWNRDLPRTRRALSAFYLPRECIFSIGAQLCDRLEHTSSGAYAAVIGTQATAPLTAREPAEYDPHFTYIGNDLGGYGYYYATTIASMGLIAPALPAAGLPVDAPTPEGKIVAQAFRDAISQTAYYREYFDDDTRMVPADVVRANIRVACLCQLRTLQAPDRPLLHDVYLHGGDPDAARGRRETLRMMVDLAKQTNGHALSDDRFRRLVYFREDGEGAVFQPASETLMAARRWRLFQAREYFSYAAMRLWRHLCLWGADESEAGQHGVPIADLWRHVDESLDSRHLSEALDVDLPDFDRDTSIAEIQHWLSDAVSAPKDLDDRWPIDRDVNEHVLYQLGAATPENDAVVPAMLCILLLLSARLGSPSLAERYEDDWDFVRVGGVRRLGLDRFLRHVRRRSMAGASLGDMIHWIVNDYVVRQHERVAASKLPDDTFRFRQVGDRLRFLRFDAPAGFNDSRFNALAYSVVDLGLVESMFGQSHKLSRFGKSLLETGDINEYSVTQAAR
jgi:hypothetical protein